MLLIKQAFEVFKVVMKIKPDIIITTGASVGIWAILTGSLLHCKCIWVDSIANSENISLSGKVVKPFTDVHITQWAKLESEKTVFVGTVL
jgi:UDP-N-acetylglucosamine:LPS N-acetylglucosamine transferase